jgi:hypothetical protein
MCATRAQQKNKVRGTAKSFFSEAQAEGQHDAVSFFRAASVVAKLQFGEGTEIVSSTYSTTQAGLEIGLTADINLRVDEKQGAWDGEKFFLRSAG